MDRQPDDITMLLVGQTGHGKSATGNSILGKKAFLSVHSPGSVTASIKRDVALRKGRRIEIVDSPGFADTSKSTEFVQENLLQAVYQTLPGFNAIVFVLSPGRFTKELVKTVNQFFEFFGKGVGKFAFILFTHIKSKERINEYIQNAAESQTENVRVLLDLLEMCGSKVMYIDNDKKRGRKEVMVDEIIRTIDENRERVGQEYFTNEIFKRARHEADRYIEENNPTNPLEINNANEMVDMRSNTTSDDNKPNPTKPLEIYNANEMVDMRSNTTSDDNKPNPTKPLEINNANEMVDMRSNTTSDDNKPNPTKQLEINNANEMVDMRSNTTSDDNKPNPTKPLEINNANEMVDMRSNTTSDDNKPNPTKPLEINNANEMVDMRSITTSDDNRPEKNNNDENISERKHRLLNWQALSKPNEIENRRKIREDVERLREKRGIKFQDLRNQFESSSRQTDISQIRPDGSKRFTHQHVNTTQQKHTQQPAYETVAQNQSALEQIGRSENDYKPPITSQCSGEFYEDPNKQLHDDMALVDDDQQYLTGSDEYRPAPGRKYDGFKKKVINDKNVFENLFAAFRKWLKNL